MSDCNNCIHYGRVEYIGFSLIGCDLYHSIMQIAICKDYEEDYWVVK